MWNILTLKTSIKPILFICHPLFHFVLVLLGKSVRLSVGSVLLNIKQQKRNHQKAVIHDEEAAGEV